MSFNICGQCAYFQRESHPEDEEQIGECQGMPPVVVMLENELRSVCPWVDPGRRACAVFRKEQR